MGASFTVLHWSLLEWETLKVPSPRGMEGLHAFDSLKNGEVPVEWWSVLVAALGGGKQGYCRSTSGVSNEEFKIKDFVESR